MWNTANESSRINLFQDYMRINNATLLASTFIVLFCTFKFLFLLEFILVECNNTTSFFFSRCLPSWFHAIDHYFEMTTIYHILNSWMYLHLFCISDSFLLVYSWANHTVGIWGLYILMLGKFPPLLFFWKVFIAMPISPHEV